MAFNNPSIFSFSAYGQPSLNLMTRRTQPELYNIAKAREVIEKIQQAARESENWYPWFRYFGPDMGLAMEKAFPYSEYDTNNKSDDDLLSDGLKYLEKYLENKKTEYEKNNKHLYDLTYQSEHEGVVKMLEGLENLKDEIFPPIRIKAVVAPRMRLVGGSSNKRSNKKMRSKSKKYKRSRGSFKNNKRSKKNKKN